MACAWYCKVDDECLKYGTGKRRRKNTKYARWKEGMALLKKEGEGEGRGVGGGGESDCATTEINRWRHTHRKRQHRLLLSFAKNRNVRRWR